MRRYYRDLTSDSMEGEFWMQRVKVNPFIPFYNAVAGWIDTPDPGYQGYQNRASTCAIVGPLP